MVCHSFSSISAVFGGKNSKETSGGPPLGSASGSVDSNADSLVDPSLGDWGLARGSEPMAAS